MSDKIGLVDEIMEDMRDGIRVTVTDNTFTEVDRDTLFSSVYKLIEHMHDGSYRSDCSRCRENNGECNWQSFSVAVVDMVGTEKVNRRGKIAKRVRNTIRKLSGIVPDDKQMGDFGGRLVPEFPAGSYRIVAVDEMDWDQGDFGDDGSCFWTCHSHNRQAVNDTPNWGALTFYEYTSDTRYKKYGRVVYHYYNHNEHYESAEVPVLAIFNAYPKRIQLRTVFEVLRTAYPGLTSSAVEVDSKIYINGQMGLIMSGDSYYISSHEYLKASPKQKRRISCQRCDRSINEEDAYELDGREYCEACYQEKAAPCAHCGENLNKDSATRNQADECVCNECAGEYYRTCWDCNVLAPKDDCVQTATSDSHYKCSLCATELCAMCGRVEKWEDRYVSVDDEPVCSACIEEHFCLCLDCNSPEIRADIIEAADGAGVCAQCAFERQDDDVEYECDDQVDEHCME